ncbi:MAG: hypothetical protein ACJAZ3_000142 [Sphingobacteriales bacterium]|jgi:hypothetical protein
MLFTFTHLAIVLPQTFLSNKWISLTGFVIGRMILGFEKFARIR